MVGVQIQKIYILNTLTSVYMDNGKFLDEFQNLEVQIFIFKRIFYSKCERVVFKASSLKIFFKITLAMITPYKNILSSFSSKLIQQSQENPQRFSKFDDNSCFVLFRSNLFFMI